MSAVIVKDIALPAPDMREILRYMACKGSNDELEALINAGLEECNGKVSARVTFAEFDVHVKDNVLDLTFALTDSSDLKKALIGCDRVLLFGATVGIDIDRLIFKYGKLSPSLALCIGAIGTERIESACDTFCMEMGEKYAKEGYSLLPRFSPGYGDLPLSLQRDIFAALCCEKSIGLTLNDSLLMSPTKSVTAIAGIRKNKDFYERT